MSERESEKFRNVKYIEVEFNPEEFRDFNLAKV
jgi:hypothetical protein